MSKVDENLKNAVPTGAEPGDANQKPEEPKKPNVLKRGWQKVKATGKAIKDNPMASAVCAIAGSIATVGVGLVLEARKDSGYITVPAQLDEPAEEDYGPTEDDEAPAEEAEAE